MVDVDTRLLRALDAGVAEVEAVVRASRAVLRVGLSGTAMVPVVGETMRRFAERHPDVELRASNAGLDQPAAGLKEGTVDVAFVRPPFLDEGISMLTVLTEERFAVLPKDHALAGRESVRPEDLVHEPWIWVEGADPEARAFWSLAAFRGDAPLRTGTRINSFEEAFGAARPSSAAPRRRVAAMTTTASPTAAAPYVAHQGEARWYGDGLFEFLVPREVTDGALSVFRATLPEGFSPPRHVHTREDEVFLVLEGDVVFEIGGERRLAGPGTSVFMPRGVPHSFRIQSAAAQLLGIITPGAFEQLFRTLSVPAAARTLPPRGTTPLDLPAVMAEQIRLGTEIVGPPIGANEA